jgi:hypothetical protein
MSHLLDPFTLFALAIAAEGVGIAVAVAAGLWSRDPARRETALKLIRAIRRSEEPGDRE